MARRETRCANSVHCLGYSNFQTSQIGGSKNTLVVSADRFCFYRQRRTKQESLRIFRKIFLNSGLVLSSPTITF